MNHSNRFTYQRGSRAAKVAPRSGYQENDMGSSKPWKRKRKLRARLKALQRRVARKQRRAFLIRILGSASAADEVMLDE